MTNSASQPKKRKFSSLNKRKARAGWFFCLPFILGFLLIYLPIIVASISYSFCNIVQERGQTYHLEFVGFENYREALFNNASFTQTLISGLKSLAMDIPAIIIFSLFVAILLNQKMFGRAVFRAIFFIPVILTTGLIGQIDANNNLLLEHMSTGSIDTGTEAAGTGILSAAQLEQLFGNMVVGGDFIKTVAGIVNNIFDIVNRCGVQMLIFLAGLQSISPSIYESCQIDGASGWETFWKVTFPMISPIILVNVVYTIIDAFTSASNKVMAYITTVYDRPNNGNVLASAMSWTYFLIVIAIIAAAAGIVSSVVFYQRRD
jgi:ABC-type sugar transport system permease subunit